MGISCGANRLFAVREKDIRVVSSTFSTEARSQSCVGCGWSVTKTLCLYAAFSLTKGPSVARTLGFGA